MAAPTLQAAGATIANTTGTLTVVLPAHQTDDILILCLSIWAPNSTLPIADIPTPTGWTLIETLTNGLESGWIAVFWIRATVAGVTNPICLRGALWDTGTDTNFGGRAYVIRGCIVSGDPWDAEIFVGPYTSANQPFAAITVSGSERLVIHFGLITDNLSFSMASSGWTTGTEDNDPAGTDCSFQTARKDNVSSSTSADTATVTAPGQGFYGFLGASFKPPPVVQNITNIGAIASGEAIGTLSLTQEQIITAIGNIASAEAIGIVTLTQIQLITSIGGIASAEAPGTLSLNLNLSTIGGIASAEAFGTLALQLNLSSIGGIPTGESFGSAQLTPVQLLSSIGGIASGEAIGTALLTLNLSGIGGIFSEEGFGVLTLTPVQLLSLIGGITTGEAVGTAQLTLNLSGIGGIDSSEAAGILSLKLNISIIGGINSQEDIGILSLTGEGQGLTNIGGIASGEAIGVLTLTPVQLLSLIGGIASDESVGTISLRLDLNSIGGIPSGEVIGQLNLIPIQLVTNIGGIESAEIVGIISLGEGTDITNIGGISGEELIGTMTIKFNVTNADRLRIRRMCMKRARVPIPTGGGE